MNCLIIGAGHGIGFAIVENLMKSKSCNIQATYRDSAKNMLSQIEHERIITYQCDPTNEAELTKVSKNLEKVDLLINCVGILGPQGKPEKSLRDIDISKLEETFRVNSFVTPLIAKVFKSKLNESASFVTLSAMVGSISDNHLGGWYGYRASKAALNMFIKTISIELGRLNKGYKVLAIHPGTTETDLSKNFLSGVKHKVWSPKGSAENILKVIEDNKANGQFYNWNGEIIPW